MVDRLLPRRKVYAVSFPSKRAAGEPEVPPEIPPEYADAYLAGFRRGLSGLEPNEVIDPVEPDPAPVPPPATDEPVQDAAPQAMGDAAASEPETDARADEPAEPEDDEAPEAGSQRGSTDLEWLFDRRESGPPGWSGTPASSVAADATNEPRPDNDPGPTSGATVVAGRGPRSPWPLVGAFVVVLLLLMLLAYLGGMAFSTIMNR